MLAAFLALLLLAPAGEAAKILGWALVGYDLCAGSSLQLGRQLAERLCQLAAVSPTSSTSLQVVLQP